MKKRKIEQISDFIHERILSNFYLRLIDWYKVIELEESEKYEIRMYKNFISTDEVGMKEFEEDIKEIVRALEEKTLMIINNEYYITVIYKVNIIDDTLEIILISEKIKNRKEI